MVLDPVEPGRAHPVLVGEVEGIAHAEAALLGGVHQEQPAQRPECLPSEVLLGLLVDDDHPLAGIRQFGGGHEPGEAGPDNDRIRIA